MKAASTRRARRQPLRRRRAFWLSRTKRRCDDDRENEMVAKTNRARAGDAALKPSKLFEGARPGPIRPRGEAEHAYFEQKPSRSQPPLLFSPNQEKASNSEPNTPETNNLASCGKSRQSVCGLRHRMNPQAPFTFNLLFLSLMQTRVIR